MTETKTKGGDPHGAFLPGERVHVAGAPGGTLKGLRLAVKDTFDIAGHPTGFGQPTWAATAHPARFTATVVERLLGAGADLVGKTICDELCYSLTGENVHYGAPVNVNAPGRVAGGSSSGSAAAVAAGTADIAIGTDCGGSVRVPASYCGIYGMRSTHGRISLDGVVPFAPIFDVVGWFARDLQTFRHVGDVLLDVEPPRRFTRLVVPVDAWEMVGDDPSRRLVARRDAWRSQYEVVEEIRLTSSSLRAWQEAFQTLQAHAIWTTLGAWVRKNAPEFGPGVQERFESASRVTLADAKAAEALRLDAQRDLADAMGEDAVMCLPSTPHVAPLRGSPVGEVEHEARTKALRLLCIAGLGGLPQLSIPVPDGDLPPLGISLIGPRGSDRAVILEAMRLAAIALPPEERHGAQC